MLCAWLAQALAARDFATADAISYLDISYSCLSGNWHALINGWWSPAFPFLLTIWLKIFRPSPFREALVLHVFSFFSLVLALAVFEYFVRVFLTFSKTTVADDHDSGLSIPDDWVWIVGYSLFFWISIFLIPPSLEQPDILVFILYLLATVVCMQIVREPQKWLHYLFLGVVLGAGYLTKSVMFPLAFVFYLALCFHKDRLRMLPKLIFSVVIFAALCSPFVLALSKSKGRFTFGDVGVMAYRHVMGMDEQPLVPDPRPRPNATPHIADYSQIIQLGTYPPWSDPSYGYRATPFHFKLARQLNRTHIVLRYYFDLFVVQLGPLLAGLLVLFFLGDRNEFGKRVMRLSVLWLPALAGMSFYALMRVDGRFLAGYLVALFAVCVALSRSPNAGNPQKTVRAIAFAVSFLLLSQAALQVSHEAIHLWARQPHPDWLVATELQQMGLKKGDRVSYMGYALVDHAWAHLARVHIVAEIPEEDVLNFWASKEKERQEAINWLSATAAKALITKNVPESALPMGWMRVADTNYYILRLSGERSSTK
jgi:Dolichyl-phosphate-mannose-protein mannosyltransferase